VLYSAVFGALNPVGNVPIISPSAIVVDPQGDAYVAVSDCGNCSVLNLGTGTAAMVRINASATKATNVAFPAGSGQTFLDGLAMDAQAFLYLTGTTTSSDFPTTPVFLSPPLPRPARSLFYPNSRPLPALNSVALPRRIDGALRLYCASAKSSRATPAWGRILWSVPTTRSRCMGTVARRFPWVT
jgi:hypothetical protein